MRVAVATRSFFESFKYFFPDLEVYEKNKKYDLVIFTGGEDINPRIYGQENRYSFFNDERDSVERKILDDCLNSETKILGVCRGHQLINAHLGGSLVQDLFFDLKETHEGAHPLEISIENSIINFLYKNKTVNSIHHQGVIISGSYLIPTSTYKKVIESCESRNIITVQFHPEFMKDRTFFDTITKWVINEKELKETISKEIMSKFVKPEYDDPF